LFFNDTATTEIYTLSLHDALPISGMKERRGERERKQGRERRTELGTCWVLEGNHFYSMMDSFKEIA